MHKPATQRPDAPRPGARSLARLLLVACLSVHLGALGNPALVTLERRATSAHGAETGTQVSEWIRMQEEVSALPPAQQLERTNTFFNRRLRFEDDIEIWKVKDYWATPIESLSRRAGDCEDFAIAKYVTLRLLGVPDDRLRLIYVRAQIGGPSSGVSQAHMVLGYFETPTADPLILDNLTGEIRPATRRPDLTPVFSFNSAGLWVAGASTSAADPTARLSRWRDVLARMQREGLTLTQ